MAGDPQVRNTTSYSHDNGATWGHRHCQFTGVAHLCPSSLNTFAISVASCGQPALRRLTRLSATVRMILALELASDVVAYD